MAILNIFKKKTKKPAKKEKKLALSEVEGEEKKEKKPIGSKEKKETTFSAYGILKSPHITEKAMDLGADNKYIFKVSDSANKVAIKKAVQGLYNVKVVDVNIVNIPRKKRRLGISEGFKSGYKKAIVTLAEGEKIETGV